MLNVSELTLKFGDSPVLNGVNFKISQGERVGIIGPNGSGKTTLFNAISGFNRTTSGIIDFNGTNITALSPARRARLGLGRVFQNFGIFREMSLEENLLTAIESRESKTFFTSRKADKERREKALEFLALVKLEGKAKDKAGSLSGGQMRLLEITRTIAFGSELFLLDEPTAGVSPKMKQEIEAALGALQHLGKTIIIIEHDINFIQKLCDRILVLDQGRVVLDGTPEQVRQDSRLQEIYFGSQKNNGSKTNGAHPLAAVTNLAHVG